MTRKVANPLAGAAPVAPPVPALAPLSLPDLRAGRAADKMMSLMLLAGGGAALTRTLLGLHERLKTPAFKERAKMPRKSVIDLPYLAKGAAPAPMSHEDYTRLLQMLPPELRQEIGEAEGQGQVGATSEYVPGWGESIGRGVGTAAGAGMGALGGMAGGEVLAANALSPDAIFAHPAATGAGLMSLTGLGGMAGGHIGGDVGGSLGSGLDWLFGHPGQMRHRFDLPGRAGLPEHEDVTSKLARAELQKRAYKPGGGRAINPADSMSRLNANAAPSTNPASAVGGVQYSNPAIANQVQKNLAATQRAKANMPAAGGPAYTPGQASFASPTYSGYGSNVGVPKATFNEADYARNPALGASPRVAQLGAGARAAGNAMAAQSQRGIYAGDRMAARTRQMAAPMNEMERQDIAANFGGRDYMKPRGMPSPLNQLATSPAGMARQMGGAPAIAAGPKPAAGAGGGLKPPGLGVGALAAGAAGAAGRSAPAMPNLPSNVFAPAGGSAPQAQPARVPTLQDPRTRQKMDLDYAGDVLNGRTPAPQSTDSLLRQSDDLQKQWADYKERTRPGGLGRNIAASAFLDRALSGAGLRSEAEQWKLGPAFSPHLAAMDQNFAKRRLPDPVDRPQTWRDEFGRQSLDKGNAITTIVGQRREPTTDDLMPQLPGDGRRPRWDYRRSDERGPVKIPGLSPAAGPQAALSPSGASGLKLAAEGDPSPLGQAVGSAINKVFPPGGWLNPAGATRLEDMRWPWMVGPAAVMGAAYAGWKPVDSLFKGMRQSDDEAELEEAKRRYEQALQSQVLAKQGSEEPAGLDALYDAFEKRALLPGWGEMYPAMLAGLFGGTALGTGMWAHGATAAGNSRKVLDEALKRRQQQLFAQTPRPFVVRPVPVSPEPDDEDEALTDEDDADTLAASRR